MGITFGTPRQLGSLQFNTGNPSSDQINQAIVAAGYDPTQVSLGPLTQNGSGLATDSYGIPYDVPIFYEPFFDTSNGILNVPEGGGGQNLVAQLLTQAAAQAGYSDYDFGKAIESANIQDPSYLPLNSVDVANQILAATGDPKFGSRFSTSSPAYAWSQQFVNNAQAIHDANSGGSSFLQSLIPFAAAVAAVATLGSSLTASAALTAAPAATPVTAVTAAPSADLDLSLTSGLTGTGGITGLVPPVLPLTTDTSLAAGVTGGAVGLVPPVLPLSTDLSLAAGVPGFGFTATAADGTLLTGAATSGGSSSLFSSFDLNHAVTTGGQVAKAVSAAGTIASAATGHSSTSGLAGPSSGTVVSNGRGTVVSTGPANNTVTTTLPEWVMPALITVGAIALAYFLKG